MISLDKSVLTTIIERDLGNLADTFVFTGFA